MDSNVYDHDSSWKLENLCQNMLQRASTLDRWKKLVPVKCFLSESFDSAPCDLPWMNVLSTCEYEHHHIPFDDSMHHILETQGRPCSASPPPPRYHCDKCCMWQRQQLQLDCGDSIGSSLRNVWPYEEYQIDNAFPDRSSRRYSYSQTTHYLESLLYPQYQEAHRSPPPEKVEKEFYRMINVTWINIKCSHKLDIIMLLVYAIRNSYWELELGV